MRDDLRKSGNKLLRERENSSFRATTTSNLTPDNESYVTLTNVVLVGFSLLQGMLSETISTQGSKD